MCLAVNGGNIFAGTLVPGVFRCAENDTNWTSVNSGLTNNSASCFAVSGSNIFLGSLWQGVFLSTDNGATWTAANSGLTGKYVQSFAVNGSNIFAGTSGGGVYLSTNNGASWTAAGLPNRTVSSLAASGSNIFACTGEHVVYHSSNNGTTWAAVNSGLPFFDYWRLAASGNNIFAGGIYGVYRSTNNGATWTAVNSGLPESTWVMSFAVSGNNIFAGTNSAGVFLSTNSGTSWAGFYDGLPGWTVDGLAVGESYIFASVTASAMHWIWRRPLSEMVGIINGKPQQGISNYTSLQIRSPGHANPNVSFEFSLLHSDQVTVKVYNLSGKEIATLVNGNLEPGAHSITWNAKNSATGCYLVKMQAGSNSFVRSVPVFK
jgi:hypothetical protein